MCGAVKSTPEVYRDPGSNAFMEPSAIENNLQMSGPMSGITNVVNVFDGIDFWRVET
jgi:hypothetical protein